MKFFLDTANLAEIEEAHSWGVLSGVTTNPTLYAREGGSLADFRDHIKRICEIVPGPVSAEAVGLKRDEIVREGEELASLAPNVVVKVPVMEEGLAATKTLVGKGIDVNMTLCFTAVQCLLAASAGARYVSPFIGRFDDIGEDGLEHLSTIISAMRNYGFGHPVEIITASVRHPQHVLAAASMGTDIVTVPFAVMKKLIRHPMTDKGLESFLADWERVRDQ